MTTSVLKSINPFSLLIMISCIFYGVPEIRKPPLNEGGQNPMLFFIKQNYLISVISLNIGIYIAITINPMVTPRKIISKGSIIAVRLLVALSTSSS